MLLDVALSSKAVWRVLTVLMEAPGRGFSSHELYDATALGGGSMTKALSTLKVHRLVKERRDGRFRYYHVEMTHPLAPLLRQLCDAEREQLNGLPWRVVILLREFVRRALETLPVAQVALFGSQAKRTAKPSSDIDVAVIVRTELTTAQLLALDGISRALEKRFRQDVQTHVFTEEQFGHKEDPLIREIRRDGIFLV